MSEQEKMQNYYISYNNYLKKSAVALGSILKYDYKDKEFLKKLKDIICAAIPIEYQKEQFLVNRPFSYYLSKVIFDFNSDIVIEYFGRVLSVVQIVDKDPDLELEDCIGRFYKDSNDMLEYKIFIPKTDFPSNLLYTAMMHELSHFYMIYAKQEDFYEYSEVLSMFFEFLMHKAINEEKGYNDFINCRMEMLGNMNRDGKDDINYALNPSILKLQRSTYAYPLATSVSYIEGLEYVLKLLDRREEDRPLVDEVINRVLLGEMNFRDVASILDIDSSNYDKINKLLVKKR